jgi:beta-lactamase regulating signal transducer with metallopeptidase domain
LIWLAVRGAVPIVLVAILCRTMRKQSAALHHAVWCAALSAFALLPIADQIVPDWSVALPGVPTTLGQSWTAEVLPEVAGPPIAAVSDRKASASPGANARASAVVPTVALVTWLLGAAWLLLRGLGAQLRLRGLTRRSQLADPGVWERPLTDAVNAVGLERGIALRVSDELALPIVAGILRPSLLLPGGCDRWSPRRRREILIHELAHIRRYDLAWLTFGRILSAVFWFHPLVWMACARLRAEAERSCDDAVLRAGVLPSRYATMLLDLASSPARPGPAGALAILRREHLRERIEAIVALDRSRTGIGRRAIVALVGGTCLLAALAAWPALEAGHAATDDATGQRFSPRLRSGRSSPLRVLAASVRRLPADGSGGAAVRLDAPEFDLENLGDRTVRSVRVRLQTPGVSQDLIWRDFVIHPRQLAVLRIPPEEWSQEAPRSNAEHFELSIVATRFVDEPAWGSEDARRPASGTVPTSAAPEAQPTPRSAPPASEFSPTPPPSPEVDELGPATAGARVVARAFNPPGAPVTIVEAWTPRLPPPPALSEAERDMDRGHAVTWIPGLVLRNTDDRRVVQVRLRFKANPESHAVTVLDQPIGPGEMLETPPRRAMRGTPEAMMVQVLGVRFEDGRTWGTMSSTIDARQGLIR